VPSSYTSPVFLIEFLRVFCISLISPDESNLSNISPVYPISSGFSVSPFFAVFKRAVAIKSPTAPSTFSLTVSYKSSYSAISIESGLASVLLGSEDYYFYNSSATSESVFTTLASSVFFKAAVGAAFGGGTLVGYKAAGFTVAFFPFFPFFAAAAFLAAAASLFAFFFFAYFLIWYTMTLVEFVCISNLI
jgi:hypothetical protein